MLQSGVLGAFSLASIAAGDMTGDGNLDLVASRGTLQELEMVYAQAAAGPLSYGDTELLGERFARGFFGSIHANDDQLADLVVVSTGRSALPSGTVAVKLALGEGRFGPARAVTAPGNRSREVYVGDFNGDGRDDIAAPGAGQSSMFLHLGLGSGNFAGPVTTFSVPGLPRDGVVADLDGDGFDDVVYTTPSGSAVFFAFGDGAGTFVGQSSISGSFPQAVVPKAADVNGDGDVDLLYLLTDRVEVSLNLGNRLFAARATLVDGFTAGLGEEVLPVDLDLDGVLDIVLPGRAFFRGLGAGSFDGPVAIQGLSPLSATVTPVDMDLDGDLDFFFTRESGTPTAVGWSENGGNLFFSTPSYFEAGASSNSVYGGTVADFDGDGDPDVVVGTFDVLAYHFDNSSLTTVGMSYCGPAVPNSTGEVGALIAIGSTDLGLGQLTLRSRELPASAFGFFLTSRTQANVPSVPGSVGRLCLGGSVGRFIGPGQVQDSGPAGAFELQLNLSALPDPALGLIPAQAGETWNFQAWHRDTDPSGALISNFTEAVEVQF